MLKKTGNDMTPKRIFFIALIWLMTLPTLGFCFEVTAHVDKTRISREDSILLTVEVEGGKANLDVSGIKDFKVISRGSSSSFNYINGRSERKATYHYVLLPLKNGTLQIPPIKAVIKGKTAFTKDISIRVSEQGLTSDDVKDLFARADMVKSRLFVGEQAVYTLSFFTSKRLSGLGFESPPVFKGFSSKQFDTEKTYTQNIKGVLYHVTQVNYVVIPSNSGTFNIDPAVLIANVMVKSKRDSRFDSIFNDSFFSSSSYKPVRVTSNPVKIDVSPLPPYQGKGKFSGLVGRFDLQGTMDKTQVKAGESITFTFKISGTGNIMDASLPEMGLDTDTFKVYDDNPVETIDLTENGYQGVKVFKKAVVPVRPGKYEIKPVSLIYFDVDKKSFQKVSTDRIHLDVAPSEDLQTAESPLNGSKDKSVIKQEVSLINKDILEIKEGLEVLEDYRDINFFFFVLMLWAPAVLFSGVKGVTLMMKKDVSVEKQMQEKAAHHLKQAGKTTATDPGFLSHLYSSLVALILAKGKKRGETVTVKETHTILLNAQVDDATIDQVTRLLETIESERFGGGQIDKEKAKTLFLKTKKVMKLFCFLMIFLGGLWFVPQKSMATPAETFMDGIKNYKTGNFKQAATLFESIAKEQIKNPYLFYNIANAYLKAEDIGQAVLWYERAKTLAPGDPDLNFNLAYARTLVTDKKETPVNIMDVLFFWENWVSAKTIQILSLFFSFVFFAWAAIRVVKNKKIFSGTGIFICSLFVLVTAITSVNFYKRSVRLTAVIIPAEVAVRSGITETSTKLFSLHAGTRVSVQAKRDGHLKILFSKDKVGWVKTGEAVII